MTHTTRQTAKKTVIMFPVAATLILLLCAFAWTSGTFDSAPKRVEARPIARNTPQRLAQTTPTVDLSDAMEQRVELLKRSITVKFVDRDKLLAVWKLALKDFPSWIVFDVDAGGKGSAVIDANRLKQYLISYPFPTIPSPRSCTVLSTWEDSQHVTRAQTDCIAQSGYVYDVEQIMLKTKEALEKGIAEISIELLEVLPTITQPEDGPGDGSQELKLLAVGLSDFRGSGAGRKANVRKGLNERLNNVLIPKDAVFSFNSVLGDKVTVGNGWQMALTIFDGTDLRPAPGGGICQVSTTLYRAALQAGLPISEQKNHSLYVSYYEKHGVGQDATVFPGKQDLVFVNDTGGPILIQSFNRGDEAFVNIYGRDDGRSVTLSGPYVAKNAPADLLNNGKKIRSNEIVWLRQVTSPTGIAAQQEIIIAKYQAIPRTLSDRWPPTTLQVRGPDVVQTSKTVVVDQ